MASRRKRARGRNGTVPAGKAVKSRPGATDNLSAGGFPLAEIRRLIRLVQRTGIGELEVTSGGRTVRIAASAGSPAAVVTSVAATGTGGPAPATGSAAPPAERTDHLVPVTSPMVGTFYRAPAPDADPYIEVGDAVEVGQTLCIVEAMKLMNEIESEVRGRIVKILVENAQAVEFGQKLFLVDPS